MPLLMAVFCFGTFFGLVLGIRLANRDWEISAQQVPEYRTPHCYRGKFYYVIPETEFVNDYVCKDVAEKGE